MSTAMPIFIFERGQGSEAMARHLQERGARDHQRSSAYALGAEYRAGVENLRHNNPVLIIKG